MLRVMYLVQRSTNPWCLPQRKLPISNESQVKPNESIIQRNTSSFSRRNSFVSSTLTRFLTLISSSVHVVDKRHLTHYHMINVRSFYPITVVLPHFYSVFPFTVVTNSWCALSEHSFGFQNFETLLFANK